MEGINVRMKGVKCPRLLNGRKGFYMNISLLTFFRHIRQGVEYPLI